MTVIVLMIQMTMELLVTLIDVLSDEPLNALILISSQYRLHYENVKKTINIWDKHMSRIFMYLIFSHDSPVAHEDARIHKQVHTHVYNSLENSVSTYRYGQNVVIFFCNKTT